MFCHTVHAVKEDAFWELNHLCRDCLYSFLRHSIHCLQAGQEIAARIPAINNYELSTSVVSGLHLIFSNNGLHLIFSNNVLHLIFSNYV
jgi:hypothetical protein